MEEQRVEPREEEDPLRVEEQDPQRVEPREEEDPLRVEEPMEEESPSSWKPQPGSLSCCVWECSPHQQVWCCSLGPTWLYAFDANGKKTMLILQTCCLSCKLSFVGCCDFDVNNAGCCLASLIDQRFASHAGTSARFDVSHSQRLVSRTWKLILVV